MATLLSDPRLAHCRRIFLRDWTVEANIGVYSAERRGTQRLVLNLDVYVALSASTPRNDDVREVVDYDFIREVVEKRIARGHINLQETFVDDIATELLRWPGVQAVRVSSEKAEIYTSVAGIGVEVLRFRESG
ncbi:MAG TPA: dihydroneopterin aldolase [Burkholderiaceae bacterium]|nr:dihydroneopterin aldolase [Burkholderiaceae bacterium]HYA75906.1 dihydroneopterin aldolase [Burkholderiaceae bacterium]